METDALKRNSSISGPNLRHAVTVREKYNAIVGSARVLGHISLAFFALAFVALLGWPQIIPGQLLLGTLGFPLFFGLSLWVLRFLPLTTDGTDS